MKIGGMLTETWVSGPALLLPCSRLLGRAGGLLALLFSSVKQEEENLKA